MILTSPADSFSDFRNAGWVPWEPVAGRCNQSVTEGPWGLAVNWVMCSEQVFREHDAVPCEGQKL